MAALAAVCSEELLDATKTSFDLCAICFVRGQKMDGVREVAFCSLHGVTGSLQHRDYFKLGADYLIGVSNLTKRFGELLVREADLVFLFDEQPKQRCSPRVVRGVLKLMAKPPDILLSDIFVLVHETTQGCASSLYDHTFFRRCWRGAGALPGRGRG
jgi:hypothetical protein